MSGDGTSPLERLRASYQARQEADPVRYVDVWEDGELIARIARTEDMTAARGVMRTMAALVEPELSDRITITPEDLADILIACTVGLYTRNGDAQPEPIQVDGIPLRFDAAFGAAIGAPDVGTPRGAVFAAFTSPATSDGPPQLDVLRLYAVVARVCTVLSTGRDAAQATVGKDSAPATGETQP